MNAKEHTLKIGIDPWERPRRRETHFFWAFMIFFKVKMNSLIKEVTKIKKEKNRIQTSNKIEAVNCFKHLINYACVAMSTFVFIFFYFKSIFKVVPLDRSFTWELTPTFKSMFISLIGFLFFSSPCVFSFHFMYNFDFKYS